MGTCDWGDRRFRKVQGKKDTMPKANQFKVAAVQMALVV